MKSFYNIILALGCLISSGSYAMPQRGDLAGDHETTRQVLDDAARTLADINQRLEALQSRQEKERQSLEVIRTVLDNAKGNLAGINQGLENLTRQRNNEQISLGRMRTFFDNAGRTLVNLHLEIAQLLTR